MYIDNQSGVKPENIKVKTLYA